MNCGQCYSSSTGPDCNLSRLTEFALRVFVVKLLMGTISHLSQWMALPSPGCPNKTRYKQPARCLTSTRWISGRSLFAKQLIYKQLVAGRTGRGQTRQDCGQRKMFRHLINKLLSSVGREGLEGLEGLEGPICEILQTMDII